MKTFKPDLSVIFMSFLFLVHVSNTYAQHYPNVQKGSIRMPVGIKIDGRLSEWNDVLQAYNHNVNALYIIANNDACLYLAIQSKTPDIASKMIKGGITFTINHTAKKDDPNAISVRFPVLLNTVQSSIAQSIKAKPALEEDPKAGDSVVVSLNEQLSKNSKFIKITGVKTIQDSILSIYNNEGIKVSGRFDDKGNLTYEIVLPLNLLGMAVNNPTNFSYNIKLNGFSLFMGPVKIWQTPDGPVRVGTVAGSIRPTRETINESMATDFWGEYTLMKM